MCFKRVVTKTQVNEPEGQKDSDNKEHFFFFFLFVCFPARTCKGDGVRGRGGRGSPCWWVFCIYDRLATKQIVTFYCGEQMCFKRVVTKTQVNGPEGQKDSDNKEQWKAQQQRRKWIWKRCREVSSGDSKVGGQPILSGMGPPCASFIWRCGVSFIWRCDITMFRKAQVAVVHSAGPSVNACWCSSVLLLTFHPPRLRTICVQSGKYWHCFDRNLGETVERWGRARMGLSECYEAILSWNWNCHSQNTGH